MSSVQKVLVQQSHLDIFACNRLTEIDIKGWIANQNYFIDDDLENNNFIIRAENTEYLKSALANDCNRMASAAIESISGVHLDGDFKKSGAWGIIRTYYSTFFAIHSIMRMFGISCSNLEQAHVNKIFESAKVVNRTGNLTKLEKGFYAIKIDNNFSSVNFYKYKDSHKDTWGEFLNLLNRLIIESENATAITNYKIEAIDILMSIRRGITRSGCREKGNWLSVIRNSVNYQHSHGVWFPYERRSIAPSYIDAFKKNWIKPLDTLDRNLSGGEIESFFDVALLINALFRELLVSCSEKASGSNLVFTNGSLKLLHTIRAA